jgi:glycosyltransferase involved in cell wall biosynthesis
MRISIISPFFGTVRGGVERHAEDLADQLRGRGHLVDLGTSGARSHHVDADWVLFEGIDRPTLWRWRDRPPLSRPRVGVFVHGTFLPVARAAELRARGWSPTPGDVARRLFDRSWMARCLGTADGILLLSRSEQRDFTGLFPELQSRVQVVPQVLQQRDRVLGAESRRGQGPFVAAVSRVDPRKNFSMIVEALAGTDIGFRLAGQDHGDLGRIRRAARAAGYGGFDYLGKVDDAEARALLRGALATVLPSYFEGIPYMALQSLAQGTPAICTDLCYADPTPGLELRPPTPEGWRGLIQRWERGDRPATSVPPGPAAWEPLFRWLEEPTR